MANIAFGIGTSHAPSLSLPAEQWGRSTTADVQDIKEIHFAGEIHCYDDLLVRRKCDYLAEQNTLEARQAQFRECQEHLDGLAEYIERENPDALVIVGDDHMEYFLADAQPTFGILCGEAVLNSGFDPAANPGLEDALKIIEAGNRPPQDQNYPVESELAAEIIAQVRKDGFDPTISQMPALDANGPRGIGHAVGFIYRRILRDRQIPVVPILMNTYFPPNQPSVARCYDFGQSIGRAIRAWDADKRVAVIASGGLTHFAIDEDFDRRMLAAMKARDVDTLLGVSEDIFQSGTSEVKNWITVLGALSETGFEMDLLGYVPCYRGEAGTGVAMGFATWS